MLSLRYDCAPKRRRSLLYRSSENCEGRLLLIASRGFYNRTVKATVFFTSIERAGLASLFHRISAVLSIHSFLAPDTRPETSFTSSASIKWINCSWSCDECWHAVDERSTDGIYPRRILHKIAFYILFFLYSFLFKIYTFKYSLII